MAPGEDLMRGAAAVAARVLADLWPDDRAVVGTEDVSSTHFVVCAQHDGVRVRRTGEAGGGLSDVVDLGRSEPYRVPPGARQVSDGVVAVRLPRRGLRRRPRPVHWAPAEVEDLCRRLNAVDALVIGTAETSCRVCGFADQLGSERWFAGEPQYLTCSCCGSRSGSDDVRPDLVRWSRRRWVEGGRAWRYPEDRPADWDPDAAVAALPARWRDL